jgi:hypothetical protein
MGAPDSENGFAAFFKRYTKTWQHAVATAGLTALGTLTFVNRLFAILAILAYVLPPIVLYVRGPSSLQSPADETSAGEAANSDDRESAWTTATVPTEKALFDVTAMEQDAYAVGADGTVLAATGGREPGRTWEVAVADGPRAQSNTLRGVDAVADGGVWFAGDGGAVGRLDPATGRHVDHSAPDGDTTSVVEVAAAGSPGNETILLTDGSGRVRRGRYRDGETVWEDPVTPGSGSSLVGVALLDASAGYVCDTNQCVYETPDDGRSFEDLELDAIEGTLTDVAATHSGRCAVTADDGVVHRYDDGTGVWTPERLDEDGPLWALALDGGRGLAGGDDGVAYRHPADAGEWNRALTPATGPLRGVALDCARAVAVGADGTIVECALPGDTDGT